MSRLRRSRVLPRLLWLAAVGSAPASRHLAGRAAAGLWFIPWQPRGAPSRAAVDALGPAARLRTDDDVEVVVHVRGDGPTVLLVHGWSDRAAALSPFVQPLVATGHRVVSLDLPAHGASPGRRTDVLRLAAVVTWAIESYDVHAVVAHSIGALVTSFAVARGPSSVRRLYLLAPMVRVEHAIERFGAELRLPGRAVLGLADLLERRFSVDVWDRLATDRNLAGAGHGGLVVHDRDDRRVTVEDARALAAAWPGGRLIETGGLGHNRLLRDPGVVTTVVDDVRIGLGTSVT